MDALTQLKESLSERYDIEREIGAGGMATVYLARDIRHDRHVALKLLNPDLGAVLGVERFLAEIRVTANLQHPNLLPLFDSGAAESGLLYYVMPYVEGESLRAQLEREKQLPIDEALRIAIAVANALDYAHSHGVIHRDLKPENILIQAGQPVIADFGIALAVRKAGGNRITQTGVSLGTPQYMSPEQATGDRVIDGRSDIYSLGALTYEMLSGDPPHSGSSSHAIIARVLTEKPRSMRSVRPAIPEHVELAVQHALEKLPADRFANAREFAEALSGRGPTLATGVVTSDRVTSRATRSWSTRLLDPMTLGLAAIAVGAMVFAALRKPAMPPSRVVRFAFAAPDSSRPLMGGGPWPAAISPDGSTIVYEGSTKSGWMLYLLSTDQLDPRPIPGTNGGFQPFFSPDAQWVAFETPNAVRKVRLDGSAPITISSGSSGNGADWTTRNEIVLGSDYAGRGLSRVSASGGQPTEFAKPDKSKGETDYLWPIALPDGKAVVFTVWTGSLATAKLAAATLDGGEVTYLGINGIRPLAVVDGKLIYVQADGAVMAIAIDCSGRTANGRPVPVLDPVLVVPNANGNSEIYVSPSGALVTSRGGRRGWLSWVSPDGTSTPITKEARAYLNPALSPDGRRIAVVAGDRPDKLAIWIYDIETRTGFALSPVVAAGSPSWSPDGSRVFYIGSGDKDHFAIFSQDADGGASPKQEVEVATLIAGVAVAPDGRSLISVPYNNNSWDLFRLQLDSGRHIATPYLASPDAHEEVPRFSPDGRWVALISSESGTPEVYVASYPNPSSRMQISTGGGLGPAWSPDGNSVYYVAGGVVMSAKLSMSPRLRVVARDTLLKDVSGLESGYDVGKDGRLLGVITKNDDYQLVVVLNWRAELERRFAAAAKR